MPKRIRDVFGGSARGKLDGSGKRPGTFNLIVSQLKKNRAKSKQMDVYNFFTLRLTNNFTSLTIN